jgi:hypothetical protein
MTDHAVKIALRGADEEVETVWANSADDAGLYVLDNVPWYAYGVSLGDVVEARPSETGLLEMTRVVRKSGNRTLRIILEVAETGGERTFESRALVTALRERGCDIENANEILAGVTVPRSVDLLKVGEYIDDAGFRFEYADPTSEELFPGEAPELDA